MHLPHTFGAFQRLFIRHNVFITLPYLGGLHVVARLTHTSSFDDKTMAKAAFYAVRTGRKPGVYRTWTEAETQVKGFPNAKFKKFDTESAASAFVNGTAAAGPYSRPDTTSKKAKKGSSSSPSKEGSPSKDKARSKPVHSPPLSARIEDLPDDLLQYAAKGYQFSKFPPHHLVVYTDGSSLGNGQRQHRATAGAGVFWGGTGEAAHHNRGERVPGEIQTNNRGELLSIIRALETCPLPHMPLEVRTDSQYSIGCVTQWLPKWISNGFRTSSAPGAPAVKNSDMIKHLVVLLRRRSPGALVRFQFVKGHAGHEGNEAADKLARWGARQKALPERNDWLTLDDADPVATVPSAVELEVDPSWLMDEAELAELEKSN